MAKRNYPPIDPSHKDKYASALIELRKHAGITAGTPSRKKGINRYGATLVPFADASVKAMRGLGFLFAGVDFDADDLTTVLAYVDNRGSLSARAALLASDANAEHQNWALTAAQMVDTVVKVTLSALDNPGLSSDQKAQVKEAAAELLRLVEGRKADIQSATASTKASKAEKAVSAEEIRKLTLENRFLSGDKLAPGDLSEGSPKKGKRRTPRG
jgi:hypothetical protein